MAEKWEVQDLATITIGETPAWQVTLQAPDGSLHSHIMPQSILDSRAAEFGIDPTDFDTLMGIVLHENFVPMTDDPSTGARRFADDGVEVMTAESTTQAWQHHQARLKNARISVSVKGNKHLAKLKARHKPDEMRIRAFKEHIDTQRWLRKYKGLPQAVDLDHKGAAQKMGQALSITVTVPDLRQE